jgi:hypothetical protein
VAGAASRVLFTALSHCPVRGQLFRGRRCRERHFRARVGDASDARRWRRELQRSWRTDCQLTDRVAQAVALADEVVTPPLPRAGEPPEGAAPGARAADGGALRDRPRSRSPECGAVEVRGSRTSACGRPRGERSRWRKGATNSNSPTSTGRNARRSRAARERRSDLSRSGTSSRGSESGCGPHETTQEPSQGDR